VAEPRIGEPRAAVRCTTPAGRGILSSSAVLVGTSGICYNNVCPASGSNSVGRVLASQAAARRSRLLPSGPSPRGLRSCAFATPKSGFAVIAADRALFGARFEHAHRTPRRDLSTNTAWLERESRFWTQTAAGQTRCGERSSTIRPAKGSRQPHWAPRQGPPSICTRSPTSYWTASASHKTAVREARAPRGAAIAVTRHAAEVASRAVPRQAPTRGTPSSEATRGAALLWAATGWLSTDLRDQRPITDGRAQSARTGEGRPRRCRGLSPPGLRRCRRDANLSSYLQPTRRKARSSQRTARSRAPRALAPPPDPDP
jgi:hypothetical protein